MIKFKLAYGITPLFRSLMFVGYSFISFIICFIILLLFKKTAVEGVFLIAVFIFEGIILSVLSLVVFLFGLLLSKHKIFIQNKDMKYKKRIINLDNIIQIEYDLGRLQKHCSYPSYLVILYKDTDTKKRKKVKIERAPLRLYFYLKQHCNYASIKFLSYKEIVKTYPIIAVILGFLTPIIYIFAFKKG